MRVMLCEENLFPYDLDTPHFKVRSGVFLWPLFNLCAYTDLKDPDTVYVCDPETRTRFIARLRFGDKRVTLTEVAV